MPILLVKVNTNNVPDSPYRWRAGEVVAAVADDHVFGTAEVPSAGNFYHVAITDKTLEQVQEYLQSWRHECLVEQISHQGDLRTIRVTSSMVSATGKNAFERAPVEALIERWNGTYVSHTQNSFTFEADIPLQQRDEVEADIWSTVRDMQYARRRWYITQAGMTYLANNGGTVSGTAAQVAGYLRDGLLD